MGEVSFVEADMLLVRWMLDEVKRGERLPEIVRAYELNRKGARFAMDAIQAAQEAARDRRSQEN